MTGRLIDADELLKHKSDHETISTHLIWNTPTVDAEPVRHGRWIMNDNGTYSCSECHSWIPNEQHYYARYCLFCGAKMDAGRKEE